MMHRAFLALLIAFTSVANSMPVDDPALFSEALSRETFNEMRCRGMSPERTKKIYNGKYAPRQTRIRTTIAAKYGPDYMDSGDVILTAQPCPYYRGAESRLRKSLDEAEKQLGIPHP